MSSKNMKKEPDLETAPLRYAGVATLLRRPLVNDPSGVDIALIGVPYDGATENRPGPRHGPREYEIAYVLADAVTRQTE